MFRFLALALCVIAAAGRPFDPDAVGVPHAFDDGFDADSIPVAATGNRAIDDRLKKTTQLLATIDAPRLHSLEKLELASDADHARALQKWQALTATKGKLKKALKKRLQQDKIDSERREVQAKYSRAIKSAPESQQVKAAEAAAQQPEVPAAQPQPAAPAPVLTQPVAAASTEEVTAQSTNDAHVFDSLDADALRSSLEKVAAGLGKIETALKARKAALAFEEDAVTAAGTELLATSSSATTVTAAAACSKEGESIFKRGPGPSIGSLAKVMLTSKQPCCVGLTACAETRKASDNMAAKAPKKRVCRTKCHHV